MGHTKGPWDYDIYDGHDAIACNDGATDYTARIEWRDGIPDRERRANLALISAAPDLLAALERLVPYLPVLADKARTLEILNDAQTAIAKAKGGA